MTTWQNFNDAEAQTSYDLIPAKTLAKVRMTLKPGGVDNAHLGWTGGYATRNLETGSAYLSAEFVVLKGPFAKRKIWSLIGLHSEKGPEWANMGRTFVKAILNSARGVHPGDNSPAAQNARRISGFADLDGIEFLGKVDWDKDQNGQDKSVIKAAVTPDHKDYAALMGGAQGAAKAPAPANGSNAYAQATGRASVPGRPSWAQ